MKQLKSAIAACFLLFPQVVLGQGPTDTRRGLNEFAITPTAQGFPILAQEKKETPRPAAPVKPPPGGEGTMVAPRIVPAPFKHLDGKIVVFAADGSGDPDFLCQNLRALAQDSNLPICVQRVKWHRFGDVFKDCNDHEAQLGAALHLARVIKAIRADAPRAHIYLVGHSSGTRVVLAAAEAVPPGAVDRVFLLGSSVSCVYDLRAALRGSRGGIVNYYSRDDSILETTEDFGTADGLRTATAGRVGFSLPPPPPGKEGYAHVALYKGLRQVAWREDARMGYGGHFGWVHPLFLGAHLVPQFFVR